MPKKITVNESPNPTGLTLQERQLAIEVLQSLEMSVGRERMRAMAERKRSWYTKDRPWTVEDEQLMRKRVYKSAYNQLTGRQRTEKGPFDLALSVDAPDADMAYVMNSLGVS